MTSNNFRLFKYSIIIFMFLGIFAYGVIVGVYKVFPYSKIYELKKLVQPNLYAGTRNGEFRIELFEKFPTAANVVFIGDSITEGGEWSDFFPAMATSNRGIGNDKTSDVLQRMDSILAVRPQVAFIMLGINDIYAGTPIDEVITNYRSIISALKENNIKVLVQSTIQCQLIKCGKGKVSQVNLLNEKLQLLSNELNVPFVPLTDLSLEQGLREKYTYDGVHLTAEGYGYWVRRIADVLSR